MIGQEHAILSLMSGKKVLYVHGFASSGQSGTAANLRVLMHQCEVICPDIPIHPTEAIEMLRTLCDEQHPDLIIGTSMGGMYAEMLHGYDRILINPAFEIGETILKHNMLGKIEFYSPRADGVKDFMMTRQLQEEYAAITRECFSDTSSKGDVYGLFGRHDDMVDTHDLFASHYTNAIRFDGGHHADDSVIIHSLAPVIRWIDDKQNGREREVMYVCLENVIRRNGQLLPSAMKGLERLAAIYDLHIVANAPTNSPDYCREVVAWADTHLGVALWNRVVMTNRPGLLYGDFMIAPAGGIGDVTDQCHDTEGFIGTVLTFGQPPFKTWDELIEYFDRLHP